MRFETKAIHEGEVPIYDTGRCGDVVIPIHLSTTFAREDVEHPTLGYEYSRTGNPTRHTLEKKLAAIEGAKYALAFSSGMAAETVLLFTLLRKGDHVVAFDDLYGGTIRLFKMFSDRYNITFSYVDARNLRHIVESIKPETKLIWLETPTNPLLKLCDIKAVADIAHEHGIYVVVDNTFMSPYFQRPLELGADIVIHSTTKYLNGHCDSVGGAVMLTDYELYNDLKFAQNAIGAILSPFDCYMTARGIKTLALRMKAHERNAMTIAKYLEETPKIKNVYYPGLESHPQHALARRQMRGFGGMLSFELDGEINDAKRFLQNLKLFAIAESLGGVESLIEIPALMTHSSVKRDTRIKVGVSDTLIRMSVGIENVDDLIEDIETALNAI